ncbi:unnamed protein product [Adineta ricciae]|uniref:C2H2-type domain-containing protein n=1 Tax=Adineta ricciae TaxID=249248 RepID=A0A813UDK1_ADIRI|nr:unnamed protein product [Adineta ricciae]CAF1323805.1 unnamed protein product [Adineta ricciae]
MNYQILSNPSQPPMSRPFVFNKRNEKIDWRRIAAVDIDRVARELDFQVLQDNIEQITLCNIDLEVDSRAMDPNFLKLYKMAQLTIEYLLLCQDQISSQLAENEQNKSKGLVDHEQYNHEIQKLKDDLNRTKKESKRRKKLLETQEKMLLAQRPSYHTCPICAHSFLTFDYLQAHMQRRHPEYDSGRKREHDVDSEKEMQRLKDELHSKETELQLVKVQKTADEERIREREETIRLLREEIQKLSDKNTILEEKCFTLRSNVQTEAPSPARREAGVKELLKENKTLRATNEDLKQALQQAEGNLKREEKSKRRVERENQDLQKEISRLNDALQSLQNVSGDTSRLSEELIATRNRYNEERNHRKKLQEDLDDANDQLNQLRNQPPPVVDRKSPAPPPRRTSSPSPPPTPVPAPAQTRPAPTVQIHLPQYCPSVVRKINTDPNFLNRFRSETKAQLRDELSQYDNLGITEKDTRLPTKDFSSKMDLIQQTRQNIQNDLPNFERIRADISRTLDQLAAERLSSQTAKASGSVRSSGGKLVTFDVDAKHQEPKSPRGPSTTVHSNSSRNPPRPKTSFASDDEKSHTNTDDSDDYSQPTKSAGTTDIQPSPRRNPPSTGVNSLAAGSMRPAIINTNKTVSAIVRPQTATQHYESESESESLTTGNVATKTRIIDQKLADISSKGHKPTVNAIAQGFQPTRVTVNSRDNKRDDDDEDSGSSLTSIGDTNPQRKTSSIHQPHAGVREAANHHHLSSGDMSQNTYDSIMKSSALKGNEFRRPMTADSAKTSNVDSDDNLEDAEEEDEEEDSH